jgi:hypothetical protein
MRVEPNFAPARVFRPYNRKEHAMKSIESRVHSESRFSRSRRWTALAIVATGAIAAQTAAAHATSHVVVVQPKDLPELVRQPGEAMFLHETIDGKTLLYVEQKSGGQLVILDVTDPAHVTREGSVQLQAPGPFDFVSALGESKELVRFRGSQTDAVLDLHKADAPSLETVQGLTSRGPTELLGAGGFTVSSRVRANADATAPAPRDYQVVDTADSKEPTLVQTVKQVRAEITNDDTGTTFLLANDGLYLIRRPVQETAKWAREMASYG